MWYIAYLPDLNDYFIVTIWELKPGDDVIARDESFSWLQKRFDYIVSRDQNKYWKD